MKLFKNIILLSVATVIAIVLLSAAFKIKDYNVSAIKKQTQEDLPFNRENVPFTDSMLQGDGLDFGEIVDGIKEFLNGTENWFNFYLG